MSTQKNAAFEKQHAKNHPSRVHQRWDDTLFDVFSTLLLVVAIVLVAYPLVYVISASFSSTDAVMAGKVWLVPVDFSLKAYEAVFNYESILTGYINSAIYTLLGTCVNLVLTTLCAFCLSRKDFFGRGVVSGMVLFTMLFNAGLIPNYLLINGLGWLDTIWAIIIPNAMSAWYVILMRSYFENSIPEELFEASGMDGCSVFRQLISIVIPLSGPIIAVIGLYYAVGHWNSYFSALLYINQENIQPLQDFLAQHALETGGTGPKVRPVVSCKGTTCRFGLIDTFDLSLKMHERFYKGYANVRLPHKFKIAVGGCPNNCVKPDLNDLGVVGQRMVTVDLDSCRGCKSCQIAKNCPVCAASVSDGKVRIDEDICNRCGRCAGRCPFKAFEEYTGGYRVYIGGRWGKQSARGRSLDKIFTDPEEVLDIAEKAILLFRDQGVPGERFADTIARIGFESVQAQLMSDNLLARRAEILADR